MTRRADIGGSTPEGAGTAPWRVLAHLSAFVVGSILWVALLGVGTAVGMLLAGENPEEVADLGPRMLGGLAMLQAAGMAGLAVGLAWLLPAPWTAAFPAGRPTRWWVVGAAAGLVVWTLPSWLADQLEAVFPPSALDQVVSGLTSDDLVGRLVLSVAIAISAPILEELVFRGYLWRVLDLSYAPWVAPLGTTALFCAYHLDPIQSTALLPTAAAFAWLRSRSGSVVPPILAHFANNGLGVLLADSELELTAPMAFGGAALTVAILAAAEFGRFSPSGGTSRPGGASRT